MSGDSSSSARAANRPAASFSSQRPGKIRFNYEAPSAYKVISDGKSVVIDNKKLNTMDLYPLSRRR